MVIDFEKMLGRPRKNLVSDVVLKCEYQNGEWKVVRGQLEEVSSSEY